jgi:hypothetical protein
MPTQTDVMPRRSGARLGREVQIKIGQQLRAMYDDVVKQGVPDRFAEHLQQIDKRDIGIVKTEVIDFHTAIGSSAGCLQPE